jgi:hypothetical protein
LPNREPTQGKKVLKCHHTQSYWHRTIKQIKIRFLSPESDVPYFKLGANPVGKCFATSALLVDSEVDAFKPLIELLQVEFCSFLLESWYIK